MISKHLNRAKSFQAALLAFIVFSLVMLPVKNGYILRWYDEMSIFLSGDIYLNRMLHITRGHLAVCRVMAHPIMYYPWAGSGILIAAMGDTHPAL